MKITDKIIIDTFFSKKGNLTRSYLKIIDSNIELKNYLDSRFSNCSDYNEILWRIKLGYEEIPICPVCKLNTIKFCGTPKQGYALTCCKKCRDVLWHEKQTQTIIKKYGVKNPFQSEIVKDKIKETCLERYGYEYTLQVPEIRQKGIETNLKKYGVHNGGGSKQAIEKIKQTCLEKYGVENVNVLQEVKEKIKQTNLERYGVICTLQIPEIKEKTYKTCLEKYGTIYPVLLQKIKDKAKLTCLEKYGTMYPTLLQEIKNKVKLTCINRYGVSSYTLTNEFKNKVNYIDISQKACETKRKNKTFKTSKQEDNIKMILINKFSMDDIISLYKSYKYPFNCDFYIKSLDMYIECNFHWTHGKHKFNHNNTDDIIKLNNWKSKNSKYYDNAIDVWTNRDILKFKTAEDNNLNYYAFYTYNECIEFINGL